MPDNSLKINTASQSHFQHLSTRHRRTRTNSGCVTSRVSLLHALLLAYSFHITSYWANEGRPPICRSVTEPVFCKILKTLSCLAFEESQYTGSPLSKPHINHRLQVRNSIKDIQQRVISSIYSGKHRNPYLHFGLVAKTMQCVSSCHQRIFLSQ